MSISACLTFINCFTAGFSSNPLRNTKSVSFAVLSKSDKLSFTCWNAAEIKTRKREKCMHRNSRRRKCEREKFLWWKIGGRSKNIKWEIKKLFPLRKRRKIGSERKIHENFTGFQVQMAVHDLLSCTQALGVPGDCRWINMFYRIKGRRFYDGYFLSFA